MGGVPFPASPSRGITAVAAASATSAAPAATPLDEDLRARTAGSADTGGDATSEAPTRWVWEPWFAAVLLVLVGWRDRKSVV